MAGSGGLDMLILLLHLLHMFQLFESSRLLVLSLPILQQSLQIALPTLVGHPFEVSYHFSSGVAAPPSNQTTQSGQLLDHILATNVVESCSSMKDHAVPRYRHLQAAIVGGNFSSLVKGTSPRNYPFIAVGSPRSLDRWSQLHKSM